MKKIRVKINQNTFRKLRKMAEDKGFGDDDMDAFFRYITQDMASNQTVDDDIKETTMKGMLPMWMRNFADNLPYIRFGDDLRLERGSSKMRDIRELGMPMPQIVDGHWIPEPKPAIVIGRGPSVFKHKHIKMLSEAVHSGEYTGYICATDGVLIECLKYDLIPDLTLTVDGSPIIKKWFDHPLVKEHAKKLKLIFLTTVNHQVYQIVRNFGCKVYWAMALWDNWTEETSFTKITRLMATVNSGETPIPAIQTGGNAGTCIWAMTIDILKAAPTCLIGYDMGYPEGTKLEETPYFSGVMLASKEQNIPIANCISQVFEKFYHPVFKTYAHADLVFQNYRKSLLQMQNQTYPWYRLHGGTINCSEGGTLYGENITCMKFERFLEKFKSN
uniref:6-hydroxymethylpterin diphosphokinase MptE-like domain-containing protein n=1 Tax=viral metagenome TaxID=1070528 RepID=A0A6M3K5X2_9ZZZZ